MSLGPDAISAVHPGPLDTYLDGPSFELIGHDDFAGDHATIYRRRR